MDSMCTRSATKHPLFGQLVDLPENQIPSYEDVIKAFYYNQKTVLEISLQERYSILADRVKCVYSKASIPTIEVNSTIIRIRRLMDKVHTLEKYSDAKRTSDTFTEKLNSFKQLFDICTCKCFDLGIRDRNLCTCPLPNKIPLIEWDFWVDQKTVRNMIIGGVDKETTATLEKRQKRKFIKSVCDEAQSKEVEYETEEDIDEDERNTSESNYTSEEETVSVQNRNKYKELCKAVDRCKISNRDTCLIVNAVLKDLSMLSSATILDPSKLRRQRNFWRDTLVEEHMQSNKELCCIGFDGKQDVTLVESFGCRRSKKEEHYSIVSYPGNIYIDHVVPESSKAADITKELMSVIIETDSVESIQGVVCDGTNNNTGKSNGIIRKLEENLGRPLQWLVCFLHCNELPFRRFLAGVDFARTTGPSTSTGTISSALEYDPNELPVVNYLPITGKVTDCDEAVKKDLSTDQLYFLKACLAVQRGRQASTDIDFLEKSLPGNISHARWLTKANRILRLYMSREVASKPLRRVTHFILNFYGPSWFKIKSNSSCQNGANNFFYLVQLFQELDALDQAVVRPVLKNNCYFAHAENILLAAVSDSDMEIRRFSVEQIMRAREKQTNSNIPVRVFDKKDITLNLAATSFIYMIDWDQSNVTSPPMLSHLSNDQLTYTHPILLPDVPCHSQAVERTIKDVSAVSCKVYGRKSRHGMVLQSKKSRLEIPKIDSKKDFININAIPPPPVQNIQIDSVGVDYFVVKWDKYTDNVYGFQVEYHIYPQTAASESNTAAPDADSFNVTNIFSGTTYQVRVRPIGGINETANEYDPWSVFVTCVTKGPLPPTSLSITNIMDTKVKLAWTPSVSKVDSYQLFIRNSENLQITNQYTVSSKVYEILVEMLTPSTPYTVFVSALLNNERSSYLSDGFRTNIAHPAAPNNLHLSNILETTADLIWVDPQNGQDISNYDIEVSDPLSPEKVATFSSTSLHYTLIGLKMGTYYICRVRSVTVVANVVSDWSSEIGFKTLSAAIPPSPTAVVISNVTAESATVTWNTPLTTYPINNYIIVYYISKILPVSEKVAGDVNSYILTNLASGTQYSVKVQAVILNDVLGEFSVENIFVTSGPKPVSSITISDINDSSANVSWDVSGQNYSSLTVVLFDNGLKMKASQNIFTQNVLHYTFTNLTPNNPYIVKIVIKDENNISSSEASNGFRTGLPLDALNAPSNPSVSILSPSSVLFQCDKVSWAIKYQISIEGNPNPAVPINRTDEFPTTIDSPLIQKMEVNDLISGYPYNLRVRSVFGDNGYVGQWSTVAAFSLYGGRPPSYIVITDIDENSAIVHWTPGYDLQTSNQVDVKYFTRLEGTEAKNSWVNATFAVPQGYLSFKFPDALISNSRHKVSIFAENDNVNGTASEYEFKTGNVSPRAVFYPKIRLYDNKTMFSWEGIYERPDIIYYEISLLYNYPRVTKTARFKTPDANTTSYEFLALEKGIVYYAVVRAVVSLQNLSNSKGVWSTPQLFTPKVLLATPENIVVFETDASVKIEWSVVDSAGIFYFEVELSTSDLSTVIVQKTKGSSSLIVIESLFPKTYYQLRVRAIGFNDNAGEWSALGGFVTQGEAAFKRENQTSNRTNSGVIVGVTVGIIGIIIAFAIGVSLWKRKYKPTKFKQFDTTVKYSKNNKKSYTNGERTLAEMEDPSFEAIKKENKLYV